MTYVKRKNTIFLDSERILRLYCKIYHLLHYAQRFTEKDKKVKACIKCKKYKEIEDFHKHPTTKDRHQPKCKECMKALAASRYEKTKAKREANMKIFHENRQKDIDSLFS